MENEIKIIQEKRKNIFLIFFCALFIVVVSYLLVNSIANKVIATVDDARKEYRPVVNNLNASAGEAGAGVRQIAQSGKAVIDQLSDQIPKTMSDSIEGVKREYDTSQGEIIDEYNNIKTVVELDYQLLKEELSQLKSDMRKDIDWVKTELVQWRTLIGYITFAFGLILALISIQDILENSRWFISIISGLFKRKEEKLSS